MVVPNNQQGAILGSAQHRWNNRVLRLRKQSTVRSVLQRRRACVDVSNRWLCGHSRCGWHTSVRRLWGLQRVRTDSVHRLVDMDARHFKCYCRCTCADRHRPAGHWFTRLECVRPANGGRDRGVEAHWRWQLLLNCCHWVLWSSVHRWLRFAYAGTGRNQRRPFLVGFRDRLVAVIISDHHFRWLPAGACG